MELKDTVEYMLSKHYDLRLLGEYYQAEIRRDLLKEFLENNRSKNLSCPRELLEKQLDILNQYVEVLASRVNYEKLW